MTPASLAAVLCFAGSLSPYPEPRAWTAADCREMAAEYVAAGRRWSVDPALLVAVALRECGLRTRVDARIVRGGQLVALDTCPMGVRVRRGLSDQRGGLSRAEAIWIGAARLHSWRAIWRGRGELAYLVGYVGARSEKGRRRAERYRRHVLVTWRLLHDMAAVEPPRPLITLRETRTDE